MPAALDLPSLTGEMLDVILCAFHLFPELLLYGRDAGQWCLQSCLAVCPADRGLGDHGVSSLEDPLIMGYKVDKNGNCRHGNGRMMSNHEVTALLLEDNEVVRRRALGVGVWQGIILTWVGLLLGMGAMLFLWFTEFGHQLCVFVERVMSLWQ